MRISGITIPDNKKLEFGLTEIYGIGRSAAIKILKEAGVSPLVKPTEISAEQEKFENRRYSKA